MTIAVVVPTKNRPSDLALAVTSLMAQHRLPDELFVVDQSDGTESRRAVEDCLIPAAASGQMVRCEYIHDPKISSANAARNAGIRKAHSEIVAVIEDDIVLEPQALRCLLAAYERHPEFLGVSGVVTNYRAPAVWVRAFDRLFTLGPFADERQPLYWRCDSFAPHDVVRVSQMGGLMSWRAEAIAGLAFDETLKALRVRGEDRDFCFQVSARAARGRRVFGMAMGARIRHNPSAVGRVHGRLEELRVVSQHWFFSRHLRGSLWNALLYAWWNIGLALAALAASARRGSFEPLRSLTRGWQRIRKGYLFPVALS
jgi:glycosyltransferase involved in cell wall biosynthesis